MRLVRMCAGHIPWRTAGRLWHQGAGPGQACDPGRGWIRGCVQVSWWLGFIEVGNWVGGWDSLRLAIEQVGGIQRGAVWRGWMGNSAGWASWCSQEDLQGSSPVRRHRQIVELMGTGCAHAWHRAGGGPPLVWLCHLCRMSPRRRCATAAAIAMACPRRAAAGSTK